jgi:kynureninase
MAAIDERTRLVAISHVLFRSAYVLDAAKICSHAHAMGALVCLDAYHSVGVLPIDVYAMRADFLTGGVLKWLCGGPGGCFLWVHPKVSAAHAPALTGWQAHQHPFAFEPEMSYADHAWRWLSGTPVIPALFAATAGPKLLRAAGMDAVREKSLRQTSKLIELADARGFDVTAPRESARRGGTVAFDVPHAREVAQALLARDVIVDYRPGAGIRVAPHFYTSDEELETAVQTIDEILAKGEWKRYTHEKQVVT